MLELNQQSRRRFLVRTAVGTASTLFIAACSSAPTTLPAKAATAKSTGTTSVTTTAKHSNTVPQATTASVGNSGIQGQQGVLWGLKYDPHVRHYQLLADAFKKKTGATLSIEPQAGSVDQKVMAAIAGGVSPDVACMLGRLLLPMYLRKALVNCSDLFKEMNLDPQQKFEQESVGAFTYGHQVWGVPTEANDVGMGIYVATQQVKKAGLTSPPTNGQDFFSSYADMWQIAKTLQDKLGTKSGEVVRWGITSRGWDAQCYLGMIRSQGVKWWDDNAKKFNIDSEAGIIAFQDFAETPVKLGIETLLNVNSADAAMAGKVFLARGGLSPNEARKVGHHYEEAIAPPVNGKLSDKNPLFVGPAGWGFAGLVAGKHHDVAIAFLEFLSTEQAQAIWASMYGGQISAWKSLNDPSNPRWANAKNDYVLASTLRSAQHLHRIDFYGQGFGYAGDIEQYTSQVADEVRGKKLTAKQAAAKLQSLCEKQYQQYLADFKTLGVKK